MKTAKVLENFALAYQATSIAYSELKEFPKSTPGEACIQASLDGAKMNLKLALKHLEELENDDHS